MATLEPINEYENVPYGAIMYGNEMSCIKTSLCTWQDNKPIPFCKVFSHLNNPVCTKEPEYLKFVGCYLDPYCNQLDVIPLTNPEVKQELQQLEQSINPKKKKLSIWLIIMIIFISLIILSAIAIFIYQNKTINAFMSQIFN